MSGEIELFCWVRGDDPEEAFVVKIQLSKTVAHLKEAILAKILES
jgi:hypothetical protein